MPIPSPFHDRTAPLCTSHRWKDWAGYLTVCAYRHSHEPEYLAFRHAAGVMDVSPLFKYDITGKDAAALLARMTTRDVTRLPVGRVVYCCWCDDRGKVIDDGTISRLDDDYFRLTAAEPTLRWLHRVGRGMSVKIEDVSATLAALAIQGPTSRELLKACSDADLDSLRFFGVTRARLDGLDVWISRTGYTGDLGYEVWVDAKDAPRLWDAVMHAGEAYGATPAAMEALDLARIEAGFIMLGVDYFSSHSVVLPRLMSSPYELGLGWTVKLERGPFIGQAALQREKAQGSSPWKMVGLEVSWEEIEALYDSFGLPPNLPPAASRSALPLYADGRHVGQATSHTWSPFLKRSIALASVRPEYAAPGTRLKIEHTIEYERRAVTATVVKTPFFNPERKTSVIGGQKGTKGKGPRADAA